MKHYHDRRYNYFNKTNIKYLLHSHPSIVGACLGVSPRRRPSLGTEEGRRERPQGRTEGEKKSHKWIDGTTSRKTVGVLTDSYLCQRSPVEKERQGVLLVSVGNLVKERVVVPLVYLLGSSDIFFDVTRFDQEVPVKKNKVK